MNEYGSDILSTRKQNRLQILSSSSDESSNQEIESDDSDPEGTKSDDSDSKNIGSDTENQNINIEWNIRGGNREPLEFSTKPGHQFNIPRTSKHKCSFYMEKYLDNELINIIVERTNLYTQQFLQSQPNLEPQSRLRKWYQINNNEIRCFIALCKVLSEKQLYRCIFLEEKVFYKIF